MTNFVIKFFILVRVYCLCDNLTHTKKHLYMLTNTCILKKENVFAHVYAQNNTIPI